MSLDQIKTDRLQNIASVAIFLQIPVYTTLFNDNWNSSGLQILAAT